MLQTRWNTVGILSLVAVLATAGGCSLWPARIGYFGTPDPETEVEKKVLPAKPPDLQKFNLVEAPGGGRLRPQVAAAGPAPTTTPLPAPLSDADVQRIRAAAERLPEVAKNLGKDPVLISAELLETPVGPCASPPAAGQKPVSPIGKPIVELTYYSYTNNAGVVVCMRDEDLVALPTMPEGFVPPEGVEEIDNAIALAQADARLKDKVADLQPHAILFEPGGGPLPFGGWSPVFRDYGYGHRVLLVTFSKGDTGDPQYWAVVDLTSKQVLDAAAEPPRSGAGSH